MSEDVYVEKLAHFKENEKPEAVLLVADDPRLIKIGVAWTNTKITRTGRLSQALDLLRTAGGELKPNRLRFEVGKFLDQIVKKGEPLSSKNVEASLAGWLEQAVEYQRRKATAHAPSYNPRV